MGIYYCDIGGEEAYEDTPVYKLCGCGKHVCSYHWDYRNGMCVNCTGTSERSRLHGYGSSYQTANSSYPSHNYSMPESYSYSPSYESNYAETYSGDFPFFKVVGILIAVLLISFLFAHVIIELVNGIMGLLYRVKVWKQIQWIIMQCIL